MSFMCLPNHLSAPVHAVEKRGGTALLAVGNALLAHDEILDCGAPLGAIAAAELLPITRQFDALTEGTCRPPLAAVLYRLTGQTGLLDRFFLLATVLTTEEREAFYGEVQRVSRHPGLDLRLIGSGRQDLTDRMPEDARAIVAAHIVEIFFYRPDLLQSFLAQPRHILLYATPRAFTEDGGVAGGDYDPAAERLQLVLSRLYEGFYAEAPGVAPFVHELGHMLDCMAVGADTSEHCVGLLPGLRRADGPLFTPRAHALFLTGKRLEYERYERCRQGETAETPPVGHPYVIQSDGEFVAGFLELFLRTPHYFAAQNPLLFEAFVTLLGQDPRRTRSHDFTFYVHENRKAYAPGHAELPEPGITLADA
jgi:hypothetical protein